MFNINESDETISFEIDSRMVNVDRIIREADAFLESQGVAICEEFKIVTRELLINAIEHGNLKKSERRVSASITRSGGDLYEIRVQDEGEGFAYRDLDMSIPENPLQIRKRGYPLINEFSEKISFNDKGNEVTVLVRINRETRFDIIQENGIYVIRPTGDITATVADNFRLILQEAVEMGQSRFRFDLGQVVDLDSISLSVFVILYKMLAAAEAPLHLELINVNGDLMNLFHMTKMDRLYTITAA